MGSSNLKSKRSLFDPIREKYVAATGEEIQRQSLIYRMLHELGYPKALIAIEKRLDQLIPLEAPFPDRRADIVVFAKKRERQEELYPLLLIECKEELPTQEAIDQLIGYNHYLKAPFYAVAGAFQIACFLNEGECVFTLPSYQELIQRAP